MAEEVSHNAQLLASASTLIADFSDRSIGSFPASDTAFVTVGLLKQYAEILSVENANLAERIKKLENELVVIGAARDLSK